MSIEEKRVLVGLLEKGMFVSRLDRDWVGTPFPFQGFFIKSDEDLELLGLYCTSVFVDTQRGESGPDAPLLSMIRTPAAAIFPPRAVEYHNTAELAEELPRAREVRDDVHAFAERLRKDVRDGQKVSPADVHEAMEPMVASLLRNVDAMFWMIGLMRRDSYAYSHAVNCSALAAAFGRHLALPRDVLVQMATGGFLLDIGKATLPPDVFDHPGELSEQARTTVRSHVAEGVRVLDESGIKGDWIRGMVASHHERHDGSGYPEGLAGNRIPLAGRIGGIIDTYDALASKRPHSPGVARHEALQAIYRAAGRLYQVEVVEQFLQCLGVYPTGSLVELNTGQVGVVMAQNQARRLRPRLMLLLTADKKPYSPYRDIDLMADGAADDDPDAVQIVAALEPGAYGLDPSDLYLA
jgi:HD-GYP domain-containing protein (c-di-GMP phosphodiesterase class II)